MQLRTIRELLDGKGIDYPHVTGANVTQRRAQRARAAGPESMELFGRAAEPGRLRRSQLPTTDHHGGCGGRSEVGYPAGMTATLEAAWNAVHDATPTGWYVGRPSYHSERCEWVQYAFESSWDRVGGAQRQAGRRARRDRSASPQRRPTRPPRRSRRGLSRRVALDSWMPGGPAPLHHGSSGQRQTPPAGRWGHP